MSLAPGTRLGPYEVTAPIGAGGMGEVYQATDTRLGRTVAIKVLPAGVASDPERRRRFEQEAKAIAALSHPHICILHDIGSQDSVDFLVMEYLEGETLATRLRRGPLPFSEALAVGAQMADALGAAHRRGIVHRDLKPGNVMLTPTGVKLLDFGLAKLKAAVTDVLASRSTLTTAAPEETSGALVGTVPYMAPEQLEGKPVDARTDVFALGCVLYEMLTGRRAFEGASSASVITAILTTDPVPVSALQPVTPPLLDRLVRTCLAKNPAKRWDSAHDVAEQLRAISDTSGQPVGAAVPAAAARRGWWTRRRAILAGAAAVVMVAAAALLTVRFWPTKPPPPPLVPTRVAVAVFENRTGDRTLDGLGRNIAEAAAEGLTPVTAVTVVPSATVAQALASGAIAKGAADPVRAIAEATGAGLVVSGAYDVQGQTLWVRVSLTDVVAGKPLYSWPPTEVPRERATEAIRLVQQQVLDTVAARHFNPWFNLLLEEMRPPRFEAQREYLLGWDLVATDGPAAAAHCRRALELDPAFVSPQVGLVFVANFRGAWDEELALTRNLAKRRGEMTPLAQRRLDRWEAINTEPTRMEDVLSASRDIVRLSPDSVSDAESLGNKALTCNYPLEAVNVFRKPLRWDLVERTSNPNGAQHFRNLTGALHMLGRHEEELAEAHRGGAIYAGSFNLRAYEARALAALGRPDEVDRLAQDLLTVSRQTFQHYFLPRGTPGYVMRSAAEELRAHGHRDAALRMAGRAVDWYKSRVGAEAEEEDTRAGLGDALYQAERWPEAKAVFADLAKHPADYYFDIDYKGRLGALAARMGDAATARRIVDELVHRRDRWLDGKHTFRAARIVALLGEKDRTVALLREAIAQGAGISEVPDAYGYGFIFRHCMDLESLGGYAPFEELIKPKG
jgi:tetratricopeptide (TPR) repeat protein